MQEDNIFYVEDADQAMQWAMDKARLTMAWFFEQLAAPTPQMEGFSVKAKIIDGDQVEHIWLSEVSLDEDGLVYGRVSNEPVHVRNVRQGAQVGISREELSDWMLVDGGRLIGGYTIRAYRDQMSPGQQEDFDQSLGLLIDEGADHFPHDFSTPEGAILCLEDAYLEGDVDKAIACKDFLREARHLLDRFPDFEGGEELVRQTAETLELAFRSYFVASVLPDFEGVERAFVRREFEDDWTVLVTEVCRLPGGQRTMDKIWVYKVGPEWRVGPPANEDP